MSKGGVQLRHGLGMGRGQLDRPAGLIESSRKSVPVFSQMTGHLKFMSDGVVPDPRNCSSVSRQQLGFQKASASRPLNPLNPRGATEVGSQHGFGVFGR